MKFGYLSLAVGFCVAFSGVLSAQQQPVAPDKTGTAAPAANAATTTPRPWPRTFNEGGKEIVIHQPQLESWVGTSLKARAAVSIKTGEKADKDGKQHAVLTYGVVWFSSRTDTDKVERRVTLSNITVDKVVFPTDRTHEAQYTEALKRIALHGGQVVNLDLLEAALAINKQVGAGGTTMVNNDPPAVMFSFKPALLVLIDGAPSLKPSGVAGVERVVNTRSLLLKQGNQYYISIAKKWVVASAITGPYKAADKVPGSLEQAKAKAVEAKLVDVLDQPEGELKATLDSGKFPELLVSSKPAELIMVDGDPQFVDIPDTQLAYVGNTASDVLIDKSHDNAWYVLISGRWFTAASSNGPWSFVDGKSLPADFMKIPPDSDKSAVLASIPGTPEARESLIANSIPQTAAVDRGKAALNIDYDGTPEFKPIDGTSLNFAWNTAVPVIQVSGTEYYAVDNGVWFMAPSATGPWAVALDVPSVIYSIPATSPLHYVTYVRVYSHTDNQVYVGYTPGYYGTVVSNGVVVYGTGYPCSPWVGSYWYGCPATYGMGVAFGYDPYVGWTFGYAWGWAWASAWYGPWWGPWGYYGGGYWGGGIATANIYGRWGNSVVAGVGAAWANPWTGNYGRGARGSYYNEATGGRGVGYAGRNTNIYTGTTTAAAGGMRYNPQTGRAVAGHGAAAVNPYTGNAVAGGTRTTVNTNTGRVNQAAGVAGRTDNGAGAAGAFSTKGAGGDASGAGYAHYDKATGDVSRGGVANINDQVYAGKDGNIYKYDQGGGWTQVDAKSGAENKISSLPADSGLDNDRMARDRDADRYASWGSNAGDRMQEQGYSRGEGQGDRGAAAGRGGAYDPYGNRGFDRGNYDNRFNGQMGGRRAGNSGGSFGAGGGGRRR